MSKLGTIRVVAAFELAKGALILLGGLGALSLIHHDVRRIAEQLIEHLQLNPARHYPRIFLEAATHVTDTRLRLLAMIALAYAMARCVEAYGLWHGRRWAEWVAAISAGIYLPFELGDWIRHGAAMALVALALNLLVCGVMIQALRQRRGGVD